MLQRVTCPLWASVSPSVIGGEGELEQAKREGALKELSLEKGRLVSSPSPGKGFHLRERTIDARGS